MNPTHPWHERNSKLEEERRFKQLLSLHGMTDAWIYAITPGDEKSHHLERLPKITLNQNLWFLEKMRLDEMPLALHELVGSQSIPDFLRDFSSTLWIIQLSHLENAIAQTEDREGLINLLQKTSWNYGKKCCEQLWDLTRFDTLKAAFQAFLQSHFYETNSFLLEREANHELSFLWIHSPLQHTDLKESPEIKTLCNLHEEWMRGFFYGLSRSIRFQSRVTKLLDRTYLEFTLLLTY